MTRQRTKKQRYRSRKYRKKFIARIINLVFKENIQFYTTNLRDYLRLDATLEKETLDLLDKNVQLGLITTEEKDLYLAFWRKVRELGQKFSDKTLEERIEEVVNEFVERGLKKEKLEEIIDLVYDQLERKRVFHKTEEWATLIDYLKVKAFAVLKIPVIQVFEYPIFPILEFSYIVYPIPTRVFSIKPLVSISLLPIPVYTVKKIIPLNLMNIIGLTLISYWYIPPYFTKFLRPMTRLIFDYDVIAYNFRRFILGFTTNISVEYYMFPTFFTLLQPSFNVSTTVSYILTVLPIRTIIIKPIAKTELYAIPEPKTLQTYERAITTEAIMLHTVITRVRNELPIRFKVNTSLSHQVEQR